MSTHTYKKPRAVVPDIYTGTIVAADVLPFEWRKGPANPDGMCVRFVVEFNAPDGTAHLTDCVDCTHELRLREVFVSADCDVPHDSDLLNVVHELRGRPCVFSSKNITPRMGKHAGQSKAVVARWLRPNQKAGT
jgi:hypothetical protein